MTRKHALFAIAFIASGLMQLVSNPAAYAADVTVRVSVAERKLYVAIDGKPTYKWREATGKIDHETPEGKFRVVGLDANGYSKKYKAPMPNAIFFRDREYAIHGRAGKLGQSHGCVRLSLKHAKTLFDLVSKNRRTTTIYIK